jgi:hypothetical protein
MTILTFYLSYVCSALVVPAQYSSSYCPDGILAMLDKIPPTILYDMSVVFMIDV